MDSVWRSTAKLPMQPKLMGDAETEVLVIGGGLTGLLCANRLTRQGIDCMVVEADTLMSGTSGYTTAKVTSQHGLIYTKLAHRFGKQAAAMYYQANQAALEAYRSLCTELPCDFQERDAYIYTGGDAAQVEREYLLVKHIGGRAALERSLPLPVPVTAAVRFPQQAQLHPVKLADGLAKGLTVYEHTMVKKLQGNVAVTERGTIRAKQVIVATHFPFVNRHGMYFMKLYQQRSYVLGLEVKQELPGMYLDAAENGLSFRSDGNLLLLGGGGHRTGKKGGSFPFLKETAQQLYPGAPVRYRWATQDCMTLDGLPYIGPYSPAMDKVYTATGFGKWGMTSAMVSAMVLTDAITGRKNPWSALFAPNRRMLWPQLGVNLLETTGHLLRPTVPRCSHLGCALNWNKAEHSWDCPCHGSRFWEDGELITGPALRDTKGLR